MSSTADVGIAGEEPPRDRHRAYTTIAIATVVVVGLLLVLQYAGLGLAGRLSLVARPEQFTELYFPHPATLPTTSRPGRPQRLAFVIADHEGSRRHYRWSVFFATGSPRRRLASGSVVLDNLQSDQVVRDVRLPHFSGRGTIEVRLTSPVERIDYHIQG